MNFIIGTPGFSKPTSTAFLDPDGWNDWFKFYTLFRLTVYDAIGKEIIVGNVKIGQFGQTESHTPLPQSFDTLNEEFFSLGQDQNYYETLHGLDEQLRQEILIGLRDCAYDLTLFEMAKSEPVMSDSLLRFVDANKVKSHFNAILTGNAVLTPFEFAYQFPAANASAPVELTFSVGVNSEPPTNIHAIIGRNGVGKTRCFRLMVKALADENPNEVGKFSLSSLSEVGKFFNVVSVAFSAFDPFEPLPDGVIGKGRIKFSYIGLRKPRQSNISGLTDVDFQPDVPLKTDIDLKNEFVKSLSMCKAMPRSDRWREAVDFLSTDPLFKEANILSLLNEGESETLEAGRVFHLLSSGHKIVLLTITRLVELVDDQTLVLIDEPEAHLHPPLLSAMMRALSFLLTKRNGVSIIVTHSPVVLQETPSSCVWLMDRSGTSAIARRPEAETFGENVGALTREVFGLEVFHSGFHTLLTKACRESSSYEDLIRRFENQLGTEGRAMAKSFYSKQK